MPDCTADCPKCPCEAHREMYESVGQWFCTRHKRVNYQPLGDGFPDPKVVRQAQRRAAKKLLANAWDDYDPKLALEMTIYMMIVVFILVSFFAGRWVLG